MFARTSALVALSFYFFVSGSARAEEVLKVVSSVSAMDGMFTKIQKPFTDSTGIKLEFIPSASNQPSEYMRPLLDGKAEAAVGSWAFEDWMTEVKKDKLTAPADLTHRIVGRDLIVIVANKAVTVPELTGEQVAGIFAGEIKNWKEVGGPDKPINVMLATDKAPGRPSFVKIAMKGKKLRTDATEVPFLNDMLKKIDETPGAIAYTSIRSTHPNTVEIKTPPLGRPITMVTRGRPSPAVEKLIAFIRTNGESLGVGK